MNEMPIHQLLLNVVSNGMSISKINVCICIHIHIYLYILHIAQNTWALGIGNSTGRSGKYFLAC